MIAPQMRVSAQRSESLPKQLPAYGPAGPPPSPGAGGRSVLEGAFGLLEAVGRAGEAGLTRLASDCGLPKTTAYRLLEQLADLGALERCHGSYRMGLQMFHLGCRWQPHPGLRSAAREPMRRLVELTGVAVGIGVLSKGQTLIVEWTPGESALLAPLQSGMTWPWSTAAGKVLVAAACPDPLLGPLPASWRQEAAAIRDRGVAFNREELVAGVCCAAVPLYGVGGAPVAALCVATDPAHHLERLADAARRTGRVISAGLHGRRTGGNRPSNGI
ncbi:IclR family transcriptional regulator [Streptomyces lunaelactis]|uniref:IclR family transcriptional regulator n=1 Tax=Streptomyces lunaelactis TaxID=1535768 RepID=UPI002814BB78|nr:helix-turn-helix domain-containing protein [Streptomyces lunaelactis]